jgi:hypothetical protein
VTRSAPPASLPVDTASRATPPRKDRIDVQRHHLSLDAAVVLAVALAVIPCRAAGQDGSALVAGEADTTAFDLADDPPAAAADASTFDLADDPPAAAADTTTFDLIGDDPRPAAADTSRLDPTGADGTDTLGLGDLVGGLDTWEPCEAASEWAYAVIPELFYAGRVDSLFAELGDWEYGCGPAEPVFRTAVLASIWEGSFSENLYDAGVIDHLMWFTEKQRRVYVEAYGNRLSPFFPVASPADDMPGRAEYDSFTADVAYQLLPHLEPGSLEEAFALHYMSGPDGAIFARLGEHRYPDTDLQAYYDAEVRRLRRSTAWNWGAHIGVWYPRNSLAVLGRHPQFGGFVGFRNQPAFFRLAAQFRFLNSRSNYLVWIDDEEAFVTDRYAALQVLCEVGLQVVRVDRLALDLLGGFGWEGIDYHPEREDLLGSPVVGGGLQLRFQVDRITGGELFCDLRFEKTNYDTSGGTDLGGHAWNLRIGFTQTLDVQGRERLELLRGLDGR